MKSFLSLLCVPLAFLTAPGTQPGGFETVYPKKNWSVHKPEELGLDSARLRALAAYVGGHGCVVRHGGLAFTWGDVTRRIDIASAAKPWYIHFLLLLLERGTIKSLDDPVVHFEPGLRQLNESLGFKDRKITWRHLANQVSCYGVKEEPGAAFDYSDFNMALLFDTLFLKCYKTTYKDVDRAVLHPLLTDIIGCEDNPTFMAFGTGNRPGRMAISIRDFARLGLLYLHRGKWRGRQLIRPEHAALVIRSPLPNTVPRTRGEKAEMIRGQRSIGGGSNQTDHLGSYSFAWWTNGVDRNGKRHWPDAPRDTFGAFGHGGMRVLAIMPGLDLIVVWNDSRIEERDKENGALRLAARAVIKPW
jgi:CubicO group peptidase (beta-lactamase class C family)